MVWGDEEAHTVRGSHASQLHSRQLCSDNFSVPQIGKRPENERTERGGCGDFQIVRRPWKFRDWFMDSVR